MAPLEAVFFWMTLIAYALATGGYVYAFVFRNVRVLPKIVVIVALGAILHTAAIAARYHAQGHLPWAGNYENGLMGGWFVIAATLYVAWRQKALQGLAVATLPLTLLIMGYGVMQNPALGPKMASLKTFWLYIHVYFAWLAYGAFTLALAAGVVYLLKARDSLRPKTNPVYERFPALDRLDELMFRYIVFGFITDAIMIAAGAIWAKDLWGNYWSWDPVETWSLVSWLMYGIIIHLRVTFGWRGGRMAWLAIFAIIGMIITFFGVNFVITSSLHMFNVR
ncbi:MAG: c-type cytochrome biogenesis protein CcsB [Thermodesulfovibrionales bacterium]